jgi:predicted nucleotidyltransferase
VKDLVIRISKVFDREGVRFIVIGALARDIYFEEKKLSLDIRTKDIDFAILVKNWSEFNQVKELLKVEMGMSADREHVYRLVYGGIPVDLIPFGEIAEPGATVSWPGRFKERMKVLGFQEAFDNAAELILENNKVKVIIPEMLVALKLSSWSHNSSRRKDAIDIRLVLENVKALCSDLEDDFHNEENEDLLEKFAEDEMGLWISSLGSRIQTLLGNSDLSGYLKNLMNSERTISSLIRDMNEGNVPDQELEKSLKALAIPLMVGLTRKQSKRLAR